MNADVRREDSDATLVATMFMVHKALRAAETLKKEGVNVEIVDPRTLIPLDTETICKSVKARALAINSPSVKEVI